MKSANRHALSILRGLSSDDVVYFKSADAVVKGEVLEIDRFKRQLKVSVDGEVMIVSASLLCSKPSRAGMFIPLSLISVSVSTV